MAIISPIKGALKPPFDVNVVALQHIGGRARKSNLIAIELVRFQGYFLQFINFPGFHEHMVAPLLLEMPRCIMKEGSFDPKDVRTDYAPSTMQKA